MLTLVQAHILPEESVAAAAGRLAAAPAGPRTGAATWRALMPCVGGLSAFLGPELTVASFVPSIMWLPNEPDWRMRAAFYCHLPDLAANVVRRAAPLSLLCAL